MSASDELTDWLVSLAKQAGKDVSSTDAAAIEAIVDGTDPTNGLYAGTLAYLNLIAVLDDKDCCCDGCGCSSCCGRSCCC